MIKVIIERRIADDLAEFYEKVARETLRQATQAPGFISGESLHNASDDNHRVVIAVYRSQLDWQRWHVSEERRAITAKLKPLLQTEEKITILQE
ncbi:MAG: antibiotic biosynthesis monooxygenase family protein [Pseudomonadales bacterium]